MKNPYSKRHRLEQRFHNWMAEFVDEKLMIAALVFLLSALILFHSGNP